MNESTGRCLALFLTSEFGSTCNGHSLWIKCEVVLATLTGILGYICACLARFAWLVNRATKGTVKRNGTGITTDDEGWRNKAKFLETYGTKHKRIMVYVCLLASVVTLLKFLLDQIAFFHIWNARSDELCELAHDLSDNFMSSCAFILVYGFLWMKQWVFYRDPTAVSIVYHRKLISFSRLFIVAIVGGWFVTLVVTAIPRSFKAGNSTAPTDDIIALANDVTYHGCVSIYDLTELSYSWSYIWCCVFTGLQQVILLGLFIYPLIKHKRDAAKLAPEQPVVSPKSGNNILIRYALQAKSKITFLDGNLHTVAESESRNRPRSATSALSSGARKTITRAILWTTICEITDIALFALISVMGKGVPLIISSLAFDLNLFINVICLIATYNTWRNILFPLCAGDDVICRKRLSVAAEKRQTCDRACRCEID